MSDKKKILCIIGFTAVLIVGIIVIPKLLKKYTGKLYKNSHGEMDFENMGPEIVKKETKEGDSEEEWN